MSESVDTAKSASDIPTGGWIDRWAPPPVRPYLRLARLDRPIGTWLLLIPCWWGVALAVPSAPLASVGAIVLFFALFAVGSLVMRGAGCTWNDFLDRDYDGRVARTAMRPIPSGAVSPRQALLFMALLLLLGFLVLLQFNGAAILTGFASMPLVLAYPLMKRVTWWPQAFLGLTFNWGALVGWAAMTGGLDPATFLLYAAGIAWTLGYDTIYAHQDKADDLLIGIKSTALKFGARTKPWLWAFYGATILLLGCAGRAAGMAWPYYAALVLGTAQLAWQVRMLDIDDPADCLAKFKSNKWFGLLILAGMGAAAALG